MSLVIGAWNITERENQELRAEIERLRAREERLRATAQAAYDYHMRGYDPGGSTFDANVMLDLMNALGRALEGKK